MEPQPTPTKHSWLARVKALLLNHTFLLVMGVTLVIILLVLFRLPFTEFIELKFYDLKFQFRGVRPPAPEGKRQKGGPLALVP